MISLNKVKKVGVVGAGTMGLGIAQISAMAGYETLLFDVNAEMIVKALQIIENNLNKGIDRGKVTQEQKAEALSKLTAVNDLNDLKADIIIEAIVERLDVKQQVFSQLESVNSETTILASNTSSIPITQIAAGLKRPNRFVGMHWWKSFLVLLQTMKLQI